MPILETTQPPEKSTSDITALAYEYWSPRATVAKKVPEMVKKYGADRTRSLLKWAASRHDSGKSFGDLSITQIANQFTELERMADEMDLWNWQSTLDWAQMNSVTVVYEQLRKPCPNLTMKFVAHCYETYLDFMRFSKEKYHCVWERLPGPQAFCLAWFGWMVYGNVVFDPCRSEFYSWITRVCEGYCAPGGTGSLVKEFKQWQRSKNS